MKIYAGVIAYNEEWIIEASLKSLYDYVDEIVVIDGSFWRASTDKTAEIARSVGPKVKVVSGVWRAYQKDGSIGTDHKFQQRMEYLNRMPKDLEDWCILHDADEVWASEDIKRLVNHLRCADRRTLLFSYQWIHLFGDPWHRIRGTNWDKPRSVGAFRLMPGVKCLNHHMVGIGEPSPINFEKLGFPGRVILDDVMFHHYGQAASKEKMEFKSYYYFFRDSKFRQGYKSWEEYREKKFLLDWEVRMAQSNV